MALSLAGIELAAVSAVRATEDRHLVHHHLPGFEGDVLQDLGRGPSVFVIQGLLQGDQAKDDAESLQGAFRSGEPVELAAALATTLEVQQVVIRSLELREQAGWPALIQLRTTVVEYIEPPTAGAIGGLDSGASGAAGLADATAAWGDEMGSELAAESLSRQILNDPASANNLLGEAGELRPAVLGDLGPRAIGDVGQLGGLLGNLPGDADPDLFGSIAGALSGDPAALQGALVGIPGANMGGLFEQLAAGDIAGALTAAASGIGGDQMGSLLRSLGADPSKLGDIVSTALTDPGAAAAMVGGALSDPGLLSSVLSAAPEFLQNIDPNDLAGSLSSNLKDMVAGELGGVLSSVTGLDLDKAGDLINALGDANSLQDVANILADEGLDFLEDATGLELRKIYNVANGLYQSGDFLKKLKAVRDSGKTLFQTLKDVDPLSDLERLRERMP